MPKLVELSQKFKIISNGVPVPLAQAVAKSVIEFLAEYNVIDKETDNTNINIQ